MSRLLLLAAALALAGCGGTPTPPTPSGPARTAPPKPHDHGTEGPHGGPLAEWGDEEYHAEFTVDHKSQEATVYVLDGQSAKKAVPIDAKEIILTLNVKPPVTITLAAKPQDGDPAGKSSRFVGTHAVLGQEQEFSGRVSAQFGGKPYDGEFEEEKHADHKGEKKSSQAPAPSQRERDLFLKPGGVYTSADIERNGNVVPSVKFRDVSWAHDDDLKPGDKTCPVTVNKADEKCSWWVNGKQYEFCCPPCLEKFVKWAKESPEKIQDPEAYRKK
jgi:hypothetical protein